MGLSERQTRRSQPPFSYRDLCTSSLPYNSESGSVMSDTIINFSCVWTYCEVKATKCIYFFADGQWFSWVLCDHLQYNNATLSTFYGWNVDVSYFHPVTSFSFIIQGFRSCLVLLPLFWLCTKIFNSLRLILWLLSQEWIRD